MNASPQRTAAILLIGDELLSGKVTDRNGHLLIQELRSLGVAVTEVHIVADIPARIVEAIDLVRRRNELVFTSGGIGPTHDDRTMESIAAAFGVPLEERAPLVEVIERFYGTDPDNPWRKMAAVPHGCELIFYEDTRWPGYKMDNIYILPGIPEIFRRQFVQLKPRFVAEPFHLRSIYAIPHEGVVARALNEAVVRFPAVAIGSYPELGNADYKVRVTVEAKDADAVAAATDWLVARLGADAIFRVEG